MPARRAKRHSLRKIGAATLAGRERRTTPHAEARRSRVLCTARRAGPHIASLGTPRVVFLGPSALTAASVDSADASYDAEPMPDDVRTGSDPRRGEEAQLSRTVLPSGTPAPDFSLPSTVDGPLGPRDRRGRPLILVFYPADWSPVCTDQLALYQEVMPEFEKHDAALFGLSVDGPWSHLAFAKDRHLRFPLLADFEPKGEVARTYGVYRAQDGTSERALFVIDPAGVVSWSYVSPTEVNPGADGILLALEDLAAKGVAR
jgi:peroxiredoxin